MTVRVHPRIVSRAGEETTVDGWPVVYVPYGKVADITFNGCTKDWRPNYRPFVVVRTGRGYKSLTNALRAYGMLEVNP